MELYLVKAIKIWYMQKFWNKHKFHRRYPRVYSISVIVKFVERLCSQRNGQNFYKGYPFVYYVNRDLVRCGIIIKGQTFFSSFNMVEEFCDINDIRSRLDRIIEKKTK